MQDPTKRPRFESGLYDEYDKSFGFSFAMQDIGVRNDYIIYFGFWLFWFSILLYKGSAK